MADDSSQTRRNRACLSIAGIAALLISCASEHTTTTPSVSPLEAQTIIDQSLPRPLSDRTGWVSDIYASLTVLNIEPSHENVCAVVAVIQQESGFHVDPVVPNLGIIAWQEIDLRAEHAHVPRVLVHGVLDLKSPNGRTYTERIDRAKTEKDLSDVFEDFIASVPMGRTLFAERNPIRTRGPMQVNVAFAEQFSAVAPYPYPLKVSVSDELFTRRGSLYFGTAHLLDYRAPYDDYLYRFADFNAGQYASRNAAFQLALSSASGVRLKADGALLPHDRDENSPGATELAARSLAKRITLSDGAIHDALELAKAKEFEKTTLYSRVFELAEKAEGRSLPRAAVPVIKLGGPKIKRALTTDWYAHRVDDRFKRCLSATVPKH